MLNQFQLVQFLLLMTILGSCSDPKQEIRSNVSSSNKGLKVKITSPAGNNMERFPASDLPTFFNLAELENSDKDLPAIVLCSRMSRGKRLSVLPVGVFGFKMDTIQVKYLVSVPEDLKENQIGKNYLTFMSMNNELSSAIENWFKAQCGLVNCVDYSWTNPHKTILELGIE